MTAAPELPVQLEHRRKHAPESRPAGSDLVLGKDILELLSTAMYVDALSLFREYIQNASDAIDEAIETGVLNSAEEPRITISLDQASRDIRIRDNGVGLRSSEAERVLTAFGASRKRGGTARGFRGVGRLSALGYCQYLTFRAKASGESNITEIRWDCRRLKQILHDPAYAGELGRVVSDVVSVCNVPSSDALDHFFEVHMEKVIRVKNDVLLNPIAVSKYVAQVAPLPFDHSEFSFGSAIQEKLSVHVPPPRFRIFLNGGDKPLTRPFRDSFEIAKGKSDTVSGFEWLELRDSDGVVRAVGWLIDHSYCGTLHGAPEIRGLRARVGDIQVGGEGLFAHTFPEERFNSWIAGEIHILDRRIVPNGRRDDFEHNSAYFALIGQLAPVGRSVARRCRASSALRNRVKRFEFAEKAVKDALRILAQNSVGKSSARRIRRDVAGKLVEMERIAGGSLLMEENREDLQGRVAKLREKFSKITAIAEPVDPFKSVPAKRRAIYEEVIQLIYECSSNRTAAKALVDRLTARLAAS